tara:strand:- start:322 stop:645 length:324 start_codon:yes stop_codon:yes gene_type:complete
MEKAITTTQDRRKRQNQYNIDNNQTPATIKKSISGGVIEVLRGKNNKKSRGKKAKENVELNMTVEQIDQRIKELKAKMKAASQDLNFEEAAQYRDEIKELTQVRMII